MEQQAAALLTVKQYRGFHINSLIYFFPFYVFSVSACDSCGRRHRTVYTEALDDDGMEVMWRTWAE